MLRAPAFSLMHVSGQRLLEEAWSERRIGEKIAAPTLLDALFLFFFLAELFRPLPGCAAELCSVLVGLSCGPSPAGTPAAASSLLAPAISIMSLFEP